MCTVYVYTRVQFSRSAITANFYCSQSESFVWCGTRVCDGNEGNRVSRVDEANILETLDALDFRVVFLDLQVCLIHDYYYVVSAILLSFIEKNNFFGIGGGFERIDITRNIRETEIHHRTSLGILKKVCAFDG